MPLQPYSGLGRISVDVSKSHTDTLNTRHDSSGRVIGPSQIPLRDNTKHLQERDINVTGVIRTRNPSKRVATDPHLRRRGH